MTRFPRVAALAICLLAGPAVSGADFPRGAFTASLQPDWTIEFKDKGKFTVIRGGQPAVEGSYQATATELTVTDEKGPFAAKEEANKTGKYKWQLKDGNLSFTLVEDKSKGRELLLTSNVWRPKK
jgi:hypothetical protein